MAVVSVSMPDELLERIDAFADEHGYTGRSEVVREAARNLLGEFQDRRLEDRELMGIVTVTFDYQTTSVEQRMMRLRHEHDDLVTSNVHGHVGENYCMELFILEGNLEEISAFVGKVRATRDTLSVDYSVLPVDDIAGAGPGDADQEGVARDGGDDTTPTGGRDDDAAADGLDAAEES